ncbi:MAG: zinc-ribbon domain-containing protein [Chloroflexota bacterium]
MSMSICPNCALPVRDGARFCTSCGARLDGAALPYVPPPVQPQAPPEWDPEPAAPAWPSPPAATTWPGQERQWAPSAPAWQGGGWPDSGARLAPEPEPEPAFAADLPFDPVAYEAIHGAPPPDPFFAMDSPAPTPEAAPEAGEPAFPDYPEPAVASAVSGEVASISAWPAATIPGDAAGDGDDAGGDLADAGFATPAAVPAAVVPVAVLAAAGAADAAAARVRAAELLTELRDLLPLLSNPSGADPAALAAALEAGIAADHERWGDLRAVMEAARDRPRDVETVLALSQQVDSVLALIDRHEQLTAAVRRAARQLRGQTGPPMA